MADDIKPKFVLIIAMADAITLFVLFIAIANPITPMLVLGLAMANAIKPLFFVYDCDGKRYNTHAFVFQ